MPTQREVMQPVADVLGELIGLEADGRQASESAIEYWERARSVHASLRAALAQPEEGRWLPIESAPKNGTMFRGYHEELIDLDFNPGGSVEAAWDGEQFIGCVWNGQQDAWYGKPVNLSHWQPVPAPPTEGSKTE